MTSDNEPKRRKFKGTKAKDAWAPNRAKGFFAASDYARTRIRSVGASRGFAETRVLTDWPTIAGDRLARICQPVKIDYRKNRLDATLVLWAEGAVGPEVECQAPQIIERVNSYYGYRAVTRIKITQVLSGAGGFAESQKPFATPPPRLGEAERGAVSTLVENVGDERLRDALFDLGLNVKRHAQTVQAEVRKPR